MTVTLHRSTRSIFMANDYCCARWDEWSFDEVDPAASWDATRTELSRNKIAVTATFTHLRSTPRSVQIAAPKLARIEHGRLYPSGDLYGLDAASVWTCAAGRRRGFSLVEATQESKSDTVGPADKTPVRGSERMPKANSEGQRSLFAELDAPGGPVGAYGRRSPREDRVTPVCEAIRDHGRAAAVAVEDPAEVTVEPSARTAQRDIDAAGRDALDDIAAAIGHIRCGSGITAIRILERTAEYLASNHGIGSIAGGKCGSQSTSESERD